jgi:hypothetical protein
MNDDVPPLRSPCSPLVPFLFRALFVPCAVPRVKGGLTRTTRCRNVSLRFKSVTVSFMCVSFCCIFVSFCNRDAGTTMGILTLTGRARVPRIEIRCCLYETRRRGLDHAAAGYFGRLRRPSLSSCWAREDASTKALPHVLSQAEGPLRNRAREWFFGAESWLPGQRPVQVT